VLALLTIGIRVTAGGRGSTSATAVRGKIPRQKLSHAEKVDLSGVTEVKVYHQRPIIITVVVVVTSDSRRATALACSAAAAAASATTTTTTITIAVIATVVVVLAVCWRLIEVQLVVTLRARRAVIHVGVALVLG
jgi:hypothetical protein